MVWLLQETGPLSACSRLGQDSVPWTGSQQIPGRQSRSRQESRITSNVASRLWYKTCTVISIGRSSLPHNGWRHITDRKVRVPPYFQFKSQVSTPHVLVIEVRNVHGERLDKESSVTELITSLRNTPRFAQQEGMSYYPDTCGFNQLFFRTRTLVRQGYALSSGVEKLGQDLWGSARCGPTRGDRRYPSGDRGNLNGLLGSFRHVYA